MAPRLDTLWFLGGISMVLRGDRDLGGVYAAARRPRIAFILG